MSEFENLKRIADSDKWRDLLTSEGVEGFTYADSEAIDTSRWHEYIKAIVSGPSGQYYAFYYGEALTEYQEALSPRDMVAGVLLVRRKEETVVRVKWVEE
ncbi:hypothetical protein ACWDYH_00560 [Nocardia goodfellowii]